MQCVTDRPNSSAPLHVCCNSPGCAAEGDLLHIVGDEIFEAKVALMCQVGVQAPVRYPPAEGWGRGGGSNHDSHIKEYDNVITCTCN